MPQAPRQPRGFRMTEPRCRPRAARCAGTARRGPGAAARRRAGHAHRPGAPWPSAGCLACRPAPAACGRRSSWPRRGRTARRLPSCARTGWLSMTAADGCGARPQAAHGARTAKTPGPRWRKSSYFRNIGPDQAEIFAVTPPFGCRDRRRGRIGRRESGWWPDEEKGLTVRIRELADFADGVAKGWRWPRRTRAVALDVDVGAARVDLGELLDREVYPALFNHLDTAFPEFGWKKRGTAWTATAWPSGFPYTPPPGAHPGLSGTVGPAWRQPPCRRAAGRPRA